MAESQVLRYRRVVSGPNTAVSAAAVASTMPMCPTDAVPSISPRDAVARMEVGLTFTKASKGLATFSDPDGTPAVAAVERVTDAFGEGERVDRLPDLVVRWSDRPATRLEGVTSARFGDVMRRGGASGRAGNHPDGGAWALIAPPAARHRDPSRAPPVSDVAATVAALVTDDAEGMPGEPLLEPA